MKHKKRKVLFKIFLLIIIIPTLGMILFLYLNEAPITKGKKSFNINYKQGQTLDVYHPINEVYSKSPTVIFIHGGAWITGRKEAINFNRVNGAINILRESGYTIISPSYTLAKDNKTPFPDCILDCFDAIQWVIEHSDSLGLDMNKIGLMGESAGAHIAMMNAFTSPSDFNLEHKKFNFKFIINIYGPNNLSDLYHSRTVDSLNSIIEKLPQKVQVKLDLPKLLFGFDPEYDPKRTEEFTQRFSPSSYLNDGIPPMLIVHGNKDSIVPIDQSLTLKGKLDSIGIDNEIHILDGVNHAFAGSNQLRKDSIQMWIAQFILSKTISTND